jgi:ribosomal protein S18 acetylase RimI-like enzyme
MTPTIRALRPDEPELYREIRLQALRLHPEAFGASFQEESARPLAFFVQRLTANTVFGGFLGQSLMGTAGFMPQAGAKSMHKSHMWGMYVRQSARGSGLARLLVAAVLDHATRHAEIIQLSVAAENIAAQRLYAAAGFQPYGLEVRSLKVEGRYLDEVLMVKLLT